MNKIAVSFPVEDWNRIIEALSVYDDNLDDRFDEDVYDNIPHIRKEIESAIGV